MTPDAPADSKQQEIIRLAFERFYEGGFHATGIDSLMAGSGISKRTLYKYFPSKEELIEAVLDHYALWIMDELFTPLAALAEGPLARIRALFDMREVLITANPTRGCLGMAASQEYVGKHEGIAARGRQAAHEVERRFIDLCREAGLAKPEACGAQINILFQGALMLARATGQSQPFTVAKGALDILLKAAQAA